ncbi:MAG TPA: hypothetical protein VEM40_08040 [Nitrospirota bacterium]|nr:hypothetical protein [Nitrospirota bacterium]
MKRLVKNNKVSVFSMLMLTILLFAATASAQPSYLVIDLGGLGGTTTVGTTSFGEGINDSGQVTGQAAITTGYIHAFLYSGGTMTDLGTFGGTTSVGSGINNSGQIVGAAELTGDTVVHAFLYSGGIMADLGTLGGTNSEAQAINNSGQIVGEANPTGDTIQHAFLYSGGIMADLGTLGGTNSFGFGINTSGQIVGVSDLTGDAASHAFLYSGGTMSDLGTLGGSGSRANGINDSGQIVGSSYLTGDAASHAILYSGGTMTDLGTLSGDFSTAFGINNSGLIVGTSTLTGDTVQHAFLYSGGTMYDLNNLIPSSSGWALIAGQGINTAGQIVGGGTFNGTVHAFLLTPGAVVSVPTGATNFSVALGPQVNLTFSDIVSGGTVTAIMVLPGNLPVPPTNFTLLGGSSYDITTDATFTGQVEVCIGYDPTKITVPEPLLRLYHYSSGIWTDITQLPVDTINKRVCGLTSSFSIFAVAEPIYTSESLSVRYAAVQFSNKQDTMGNVLLWADFKVPLPAASDVITGTFDGVTLFSAPFSQFKHVLPNVYWYFENGDSVTIDFKLGQIIVITPRISLAGLDNSNGVDVQFTLNGSTGMEIGFQNITMTPEPINRLVYRRHDICGNPL